MYEPTTRIRHVLSRDVTSRTGRPRVARVLVPRLVALAALAALAGLALATSGCTIEFVDYHAPDASMVAVDAAVDAPPAVDGRTRPDAHAADCGDGVVSDGEACEPPTAGCSDACQWVASQVPIMTGDMTPSGLVERSGVYDADHEGWLAFDGSDASMWISAEFEPAWLSYAWTDGPRTITAYAINFVNGSLTSRAPRDFTLQGWDGEAWIIIDSRVGEADWKGAERRQYSVAFPGPYPRYRLRVTDDNDAREGVVVTSMGRLELIGSR